MVKYEWEEEACRRYAEGLRPVVMFDHSLWAVRIARMLKKHPKPVTILDVATGPGFLLFELAKHLGKTTLIAHDESPPMLLIAQEEAQRRGLSIQMLNSPAEEIEIEDQTVDVVTCKQLLHEAHDVDQTLSEIVRVLRPGGQAFVIDFDASGSRAAAQLLRSVLMLARGPFVASGFWKSFNAGLEGVLIEQKMHAAGLTDVRYAKAGLNFFISGRKRAESPPEAQPETEHNH